MCSWNAFLFSIFCTKFCICNFFTNKNCFLLFFFLCVNIIFLEETQYSDHCKKKPVKFSYWNAHFEPTFVSTYVAQNITSDIHSQQQCFAHKPITATRVSYFRQNWNNLPIIYLPPPQTHTNRFYKPSNNLTSKQMNDLITQQNEHSVPARFRYTAFADSNLKTLRTTNL